MKTAGRVGEGPVLLYCTGIDGLVKYSSRRPLVCVAWGDGRWLDGWAAARELWTLPLANPSRRRPSKYDVAQ
jgi:hypothetical protein